MKDADAALSAFSAMLEASGAGGSRLLERDYLASLLGKSAGAPPVQRSAAQAHCTPAGLPYCQRHTSKRPLC
jgi:hypothetical protein